MTRKIQAISTNNAFTQDGSAPAESIVTGRLLFVQGEADGKPTYDFTVILRNYYYNGTSYVVLGVVSSTRYVGTRNGGKVHLFNDYPQLSLPTLAGPTVTGTVVQQISIVPGEGVNLQIYANNALLLSN